MEAVIPSLLEARALFEFTPEAQEEVSSFFLNRADTDRGDGFLPELTYLTAAEFALSPILIYPRVVLPVPEPIPVDVPSVRLALAKANCMFIEFCSERMQDGSLRLPDVTAFGGDIAKLEAIGVSPDEPPTEIGDLARAVDALEHAHRQAATDFAQQVGESGVLRLQGFLWAVKLSLPRRDPARAVADSYDAFELSQPVAGQQVVPA